MKAKKVFLYKLAAAALGVIFAFVCTYQTFAAALPQPSGGGETLSAAEETPEGSEYSSVREETFFGKWENGYWTVVPKLDYSIAALSEVEKCAKQGHYSAAKEALLSYYRLRDTVSGLSPTAQTGIAADLLLQNIIAWEYTDYLSYTAVDNEQDWYSFDVRDGISLGRQVGLELMARGKTDDVAVFGSRESGNSPRLELTVNGTPVVLYPVKDATIRAGSYRTTAYGTEDTLEVNDTGYPADDNARRAVLVFDLSGLSGVVTSADLQLYGNTTQGRVEIMAVKHADIAWAEGSLTYSTANLRIFSWEGDMSAWDWGPPDGCAVQFDLTTLTMRIMENLLNAYHATQRADYAQKAIEMLTCVSAAGGDNPRLGDPLRTGSRGETMTNQFAYLVKTPYMTAQDCFDIVYYMWVQGEFLGDPLLEYPRFCSDQNVASYAPVSNWGVTQTAGLYFLSHYFYEFTGAADWQALSNARIDDIIASLINVDGSYNEDCTSYVSVTLNSFLNLVKLAQLNGFALSQGTVLRIMNCLEYVMTYSMPNGYDPNYGDASAGDTTSIVRQYVDIFGDEGSLLYYVTHGRSGTEPEYDSKYYPYNRWAILRSGWNEDSLYMHINTQSGTHNHWDSNAVIMYAYGRNLLIDSGRKSYDDTDPDTLWQRKSVESHNTLQVDGTAGRPGSFVNEVLAFNTTGIAAFYQGYNEQASADTGHTRTVFMINDGFYIVSDFVENRADSVRTYSLNWHMPVSSNPAVSASKTYTRFGTGANLQIIPSVAGSAELKEGVLSQGAIGEAVPYPYVKYSYTSQENLNISTLLYPTREGATQNVAVENIALTGVENNLAQAMRIDFDGTRSDHTGYYYISNEDVPAERAFGELRSNGKLVYAEYDAEGNLVRIVFTGGTMLTGGSTPLLAAPGTLGLFAADYAGTSLVLEGDLVPCTDRAQAIRVYAPGIENVTVNGETVEFERDGDYIYAARSSESEEVSAADAAIESLPAVAELTYADADTVATARYTADMCLAKGFAPDAGLLETLVQAEDRIALLGALQDIEEDISLLLPYGVTMTTESSLRTLQAQLEECRAQYGADDVAAYLALAEKLQAYDEETQQLAAAIVNKTHIKSYSVTESVPVSYEMEQTEPGSGQGYNGFYYRYFTEDGCFPMDSTGHHATNLTDTYYTVQGSPGVHWGAEGVSSTTAEYALSGWEADRDCTVKLDLSVWATAYMVSNAARNDGAYVYVSVGTQNSGYPFESDMEISPDAVYSGYVDPLKNGASSPLSGELVFELKAGDVIWFGITPNETATYDVLIVDASVNILENAQAKPGVAAEDAFAAVERIQDTVFSMLAPENVTVNDGSLIAQMDADLSLFEDPENFYLYEQYQLVKEAWQALGVVKEGSFAVTALSAEGGTIRVGSITAKAGETVSVEVIPDAGYKFVPGSIAVNGTPVDSLNFIMPDCDVTITAEFERIGYTVEAAEQSGVTVRFSAENAAEGDKVFFAFDVAYGYRIREGSVRLNGEAVTGNWFIMPSRQVLLTYEVEKIPVGDAPVGWIIGGSVGGAVLLAGAAAAVVLYLKRRKVKK